MPSKYLDQLSMWSAMTSEAVRTLTGVLIVIVGASLAWALLSRATHKARHEYQDLLGLAAQPGAAEGDLSIAQRKLTALRLIVNAARYAIAFVALLLILGQLDVNVSGLLLPAGFLGAALGVGAQNVVRDVLAGLFFLFEAQFAVGDSVSINGVSGVVEEVGVRVTSVRDAQGQVHFFANGAITSVARRPRRMETLLLRLPLFSLGESARLDAAVLGSHEDFSSLFDSLATPPERLTIGQLEAADEHVALEKEAADGSASAEAPRAIGFAWWRWEVQPSRSSVWREKFGAQLSAQLRRARLEGVAGEAEVLAAPVEV